MSYNEHNEQKYGVKITPPNTLEDKVNLAIGGIIIGITLYIAFKMVREIRKERKERK